VLVDKVGGIRLCDFGFGKIFDASKLLDTYCGSPFYAAPEMVTATPYRGPPVDMWSCGVILYAMLTGQLPFHCDTMPELFKKISLAQYTEPNTLSVEALNLIRSLLSRNPKRRITAENVLKHPWLVDQPISTASSIRKKMIKIPSSAAATFNKYKPAATNNIYPSALNTSISSPASTLPSPMVSVGDEELASYSTPDQRHQRSSRATRFLLHALNKKSQVAPSREKQKDASSTAKKGSRALLVTAERIKKFFSNAFIQKRLTTI
jgi:serine/threonine protein kinase